MSTPLGSSFFAIFSTSFTACAALHCNRTSLTEKLAAEIHGAGYSILLWTVNEPAEAKRLFKLGADCVVTDALDRIGPNFS